MTQPPSISNEQPLLEEDRKEENQIKAFLSMFISTIAIAVSSLFVKLSSTKFPLFQIVLSRSLFQLGTGLIFCLTYKKDLILTNNKKMNLFLVLRGLLGSLGLGIFYFTLSQIPLAEASVIFFTAPIITAILSSLFLNEKFGKFDMLCSFVCFIGVFMVLQPLNFVESNNLEDPIVKLSICLLALFGAFLAAGAYVVVRFIGKEIHYMVHVVYFGLISTILSTFGLVIWQSPIALQFDKPTMYLILTGATATIGQIFLNKGLQLYKAGPVILVRNLDIPIAYILGIFVLNEIPTVLSITGSAVVLSSVITRALKKTK